MDKEDILNKINEAIERNHFAHSDLARRLGVTRPTLTSWRNGSGDIGLEYLIRLIDILDLEIEVRSNEDDNYDYDILQFIA